MTVDNAVLHARNALAFLALISLCGCASIVGGKSRQEVTIDSTPPGALVMIYDKSNTRFEHGTTPFEVRLHRSSGYFSGARYKLVFELAGYQKAESLISSRIDGWYWCNFIIGGPLGLLIIDPATGAMWTLPTKRVEQVLEPLPAPAAPSANAAPAAQPQAQPPQVQPQAPGEQPATPPAPSQPPETPPAPKQ